MSFWPFELSRIKFKSLFNLAPIHPVQMALFILIELLLLFGKDFAKFHLFWYFHLYDFLFLALGVVSLVLYLKRGDRELLWPPIFLFVLSGVYFIYSFIVRVGPLEYMVRHYAIFGYLGLSYIIFFSFVDTKRNLLNVQFIILIGLASVVIQVIYHMYNFLSIGNYYSRLFTEFNYYSLLAFPGIFVFQSYVMVFDRNPVRKWGLILLCIGLTMTMGHHSSAVLCSICVPVAFLLLKSPRPIRVIGILVLVVSIIPLFKLVPQFQDHNSLWRLIYWRLTLKDLFLDNYALLGNGFGGKFTSTEILAVLRADLNSPWMELRSEEQYLSPMHNSFITLAFHIGILPSLLLLLPLRRVLMYFFEGNFSQKTPEKDFLLLSLMGLMLWASFHVVLELPHSSAFFWLVYFTAIFFFTKDRELVPDVMKESHSL